MPILKVQASVLQQVDDCGGFSASNLVGGKLARPGGVCPDVRVASRGVHARMSNSIARVFDRARCRCGSTPVGGSAGGIAG
eukprot:6475565-Amphidinium_carterae.1